jgi:hypothetical protein
LEGQTSKRSKQAKGVKLAPNKEEPASRPCTSTTCDGCSWGENCAGIRFGDFFSFWVLFRQKEEACKSYLETWAARLKHSSPRRCREQNHCGDPAGSFVSFSFLLASHFGAAKVLDWDAPFSGSLRFGVYAKTLGCWFGEAPEVGIEKVEVRLVRVRFFTAYLLSESLRADHCPQNIF